MDPGVKVTLSKHQPPPHRPLRRPGRGQNETALLRERQGVSFVSCNRGRDWERVLWMGGTRRKGELIGKGKLIGRGKLIGKGGS